MRSLISRVVVAAVLVLSSASAHAQQPAGDTATAKTDQARELMLKGNRHFEKGEWEKAYAAYVASWALKKHYSLAGNLAEVEAKLGKHKDAAEHLQYYLTTLPKGRDKDRQRAEKQLVEAKKHVVTVSVTANQSGAEIKIDGTAVGKTPLDGDVFLDPGDHRVEAELEGYTPAKIELSAKAGEGRQVALSLEKPSSGTPPSLPGSGLTDPPSPSKPSNPGTPPAQQDSDANPDNSVRTAVLITGAGLAVVGLGAGVYFKLRAGSAQDDVDSFKDQAQKELGGNCPAGSSAAVCRDLADAADRRNSSNQMATIAFIGGGVLAGATIATYFLWQPKPKQSARRVSVQPAIGRRTNGLVLTGSF